ncbi:Regulator of G-protein signaling 6 [Willisornis vidua]|uniref:Regulator of G-protein signaling 6 n=1 Tax=Willisornis vidua TaxID=1566151 RepID=A0ABQ9D7U7_9PASS|nr:Regulator of G-protein signaling 6 [Willisornis vidua]
MGLREIEDIVTRMQDDKTGGVPIRTVKSFLSKIPSVVTGSDIVQWLMKNLGIEDTGEAIHLGSLIAAQGYVFPISDHVLTLKDDGTFYRFQVAIYLCKRTMQNKARLELADYEAFVVMPVVLLGPGGSPDTNNATNFPNLSNQSLGTEYQERIDRKKDKTERKILDSQERAFWDVHRPVSVYGVTEESQPQSPVHMPSQPVRKTTKEDFRKQIIFLNMQIERHCLKMSKVAESLIAYTEQYVEYDPFITPAEPSNPWISDDVALWDIEMSKEPSQQRVKRWGFSMDEVLKDPVGRDQFLRFLESEFSSENLRFGQTGCVSLWPERKTYNKTKENFLHPFLAQRSLPPLAIGWELGTRSLARFACLPKIPHPLQRCKTGGAQGTDMELLRQGEECAQILTWDSYWVISLSSQRGHVLPQDGGTDVASECTPNHFTDSLPGRWENYMKEYSQVSWVSQGYGIKTPHGRGPGKLSSGLI